MHQHIENRPIENFGPHATRALGIVLALLVAGCDKPSGSGNQDAAADAPPLIPALTVVFSEVPATIGLGESVVLTATVTANVTVTDLACTSWSSPPSITPNADATTCNGVIEANVPCVYAFNLSGDGMTIYSWKSEYDLFGDITCTSHAISQYEYEMVSATMVVPQPDAGMPPDTAPLVGTLSVVLSPPSATLYVGQAAEVTATVTATVPLSDIVCFRPSDSYNLSKGVSVTCNGTVAANTPCEYGFTFSSWPGNLERGELEKVITDTIACGSDALNVYQGQSFSVTLQSNSQPIGDAGASYCSTLTAGMIGTGSPSIQITNVPPRGSSGKAQGTVSGAIPDCYQVVVYIYVVGSWWVKPYSAEPLTTINDDGTWSANIVTGGTDQDATSIIAYLVPSDYVGKLDAVLTPPKALAAFPSATVNR